MNVIRDINSNKYKLIKSTYYLFDCIF